MEPRLQVGSLTIRAFSDGVLKTSLDLLRDIDRATAATLSGAAADGALFIPVNNYLFERDGAVVLIDAGAGDTMQPTLGRLPAALRAGGVAPEAVTHILLTHIHPDHANGLVDAQGAAVFPKAQILTLDVEHDFWMADGVDGEPASVTRTRERNRINLAPYRERIVRMREGETWLGCTPSLAAGHTPGHACWRIEAGPETLLAWGDVVHLSRVQIAHPEAALTYDLDPAMAKRTRRRIFDMAADEGLVIAGAHVEAPGVGRIKRSGSGHVFEPL